MNENSVEKATENVGDSLIEVIDYPIKVLMQEIELLKDRVSKLEMLVRQTKD